MRKYSKAVAALVSAFVAFLVVQFPDIDGAVLEGAILMILTTAGVFVSPANGG